MSVSMPRIISEFFFLAKALRQDAGVPGKKVKLWHAVCFLRGPLHRRRVEEIE
jgi:hypothetical protein